MSNDSVLEIVACGAWNGGTVVDNSNYEIFGDMDGKGVFLYATRGARAHLNDLFSANHIKLDDIDLLFEHQANFAMIPLTLTQLSDLDAQQSKKMVADLIANKMVTSV